MSLKDSLVSHFEQLKDDEKLLSECVTLCQNYNLSSDDFYYKWEAMSYSGSQSHFSGSSSTISSKDVHMISMNLQRDLLLKSRKERISTHVSTTPQVNIKRDPGMKRPLAAARASSRPGIPRVKFKGPGKTAENRQERSFRYMYEKFSDRSAALDERIDKIGSLVKEYYQLDDLGDPSLTTEDEVVVVGRICSEADSSINQMGKLNENNVYLESSRMGGSGTRILLRFDSQLKIKGSVEGSGGIGIFPGAIVALRGKNGSGEYFSVTEILSIPRMAVSPEAKGSASSQESSTFSMCIASGPYTSDADLQYNYLNSFFSKIKSMRPAVLLLLGPFLDTFHPIIASGDIDQPIPELFEKHFAEPLREFLEVSPDSIVLLLPSVRDIISDHAVYPQSEFTTLPFDDVRIQMLPNPSRFTINEVEFAATSVDVLSHLRSQEVIKRGQETESVPYTDTPGNDAMANACRHILQQRSFYPLFPVPVDFSRDVNLDVTHSDLLEIDHGEMKGHYLPDVLVLPSRLKQFSKIVDLTVAINTGWVSKGFYSVIYVEAGQDQPLKQRMTTEIARL